MEIETCSTSALGLAAAKSWFTVTTKVNERNRLISIGREFHSTINPYTP